MKIAPHTDSVFLRYFKENDSGEETNEVYVSLANLDYSGVPIDSETGDDLDCDGFLYAFIGGGKYRQIVGLEVAI